MDWPRMARPTGISDRARQRGAIYLLVLGFVSLTGAALATLGQAWSLDARREKEAELLWVGAAYRQAIRSYYEMSPGPLKTYPGSIDQLLLDPRFPDTRRHLRQRYLDPITQRDNWILIDSPAGGVMGVASRSESAPLKQSGFDGSNRVFNDVSAQLKEKTRYRDWEFVHSPPFAGG